MESRKFRFNKEEWLRVVRVFGWTVASAAVALLIGFVGLWEVPMEYAFIVPVVNTVLYALAEFIKGQ